MDVIIVTKRHNKDHLFSVNQLIKNQAVKAMNYYLEVIRKFRCFGGRARRSEFWYFTSFNFLIFFLLFATSFIFNIPLLKIILSVVSIVFGLVILLPTISVSIRRLQDTSRSGWWLLLILVPVIGAITLFFFMLEDSSPAYNIYGEYPKFTYLKE